MGRIEDALNKLQARSQAAAKTVAPPLKRLGVVVPHEHTYGGGRIVVDTVELQANGLLVPDVEERRLAEQYRAIKRPLLRNADTLVEPPVPRGNLVMVASALSGEGKTFTCVNLCLSIARERDWEVVLVDADCSKPHLTRLFAAEQQRGLIDLLRDPSLKFDDLVMPTDVPGFSVLPAGAPDSQASELLASKRMEDICDALASGTGRMIVFDSSPLLLTTEAAELAAHVGQILVVVRANETPQHAVVAALEKLNETKAIGCVLNQTWGSSEPSDSYGYYGYGADEAAAS